jgi:PKD repeat protein
VRVRINQDPNANTPPIAQISGPSTAKENDTVNFSGSGSQSVSPIVDYQWNFGDGTTAGGSNVSHQYSQQGTYDVSLIVVAQNGLRSSARQQIRIDPLSAVSKPVAIINAPASGQLGQPVTFDASASTAQGKIVSYVWNFGDGSSANAVNASHTYQNGAGTYIVTLTVTDDLGQTNTANHQIDITAAAQPTPTPTDTPAVPTNTPPPTATDTPVTAATPTDTPAPGQPTPTDTPVAVATPLPLPQPPVAAINAPAQALAGAGVLMDGSLSQSVSPIVSWVWDYGDGVVENSGMGVGHTYAAAGNYVVTLTITDQNGQSGSTTHNIQIDPAPTQPQPQPQPLPQITPPPPQPTNTPAPQATPTPPPQPPVAVLNAPNQGQVGQLLSLDGSLSQSSSPIVSWQWDYGDGMIDSSGMAVPHIYNAPGQYNLTLTITDQNGLSDTTSQVIDIQPAPQAVPQITPPPPQPAQPAPQPAPQQQAAPTDTPVPPPPPTDTPVPAPTDTPVPAPTDTPVPPPTDTPVPTPTP